MLPHIIVYRQRGEGHVTLSASVWCCKQSNYFLEISEGGKEPITHKMSMQHHSVKEYGPSQIT